MALSLNLSCGMIATWYDLFVRVHVQCHSTGEQVVPFEDTEYYADWIHNLTDGQDREGAELMAYAVRDHHRRLSNS